MKLSTATSLGFLVAFVVPAVAQPTIAEGPGHEIGAGTVLHPIIGLETGFISNVFYEDTSPISSGLARLIAGISIASQENKPDEEVALVGTDSGFEPSDTPPVLDFRLGARLEYEQYLSSNDNVRDASDLRAIADLHLVIFPKGPVSFWLDDSFTRDTRPTNFESSENLNRDINHLKLGIDLRPGGGTLTFGARYENTIDRFESSANSFANRFQHTIGAKIDWQFRPFTKLFIDSSLGFFDGLGDSETKVSSNPLRVRAGVATLLGVNTSLRLHGGYGKGYYDAGEDFASFIGGVEVAYRYSELGRVSIAYERDFKDSINANLYTDHAMRMTVNQQLGLLVFGAQASLRFREYRGISFATGGNIDRDDTIFDGRITAQYPVREWLGLSAKFHTTIDETDFRQLGDDPGYRRFDVFAGATAAF